MITPDPIDVFMTQRQRVNKKVSLNTILELDADLRNKYPEYHIAFNEYTSTFWIFKHQSQKIAEVCSTNLHYIYCYLVEVIQKLNSPF